MLLVCTPRANACQPVHKCRPTSEHIRPWHPASILAPWHRIMQVLAGGARYRVPKPGNSPDDWGVASFLPVVHSVCGLGARNQPQIGLAMLDGNLTTKSPQQRQRKRARQIPSNGSIFGTTSTDPKKAEQAGVHRRQIMARRPRLRKVRPWSLRQIALVTQELSSWGTNGHGPLDLCYALTGGQSTSQSISFDTS